MPPEDRAQFSVNVELPTGTSLETTTKVAEAIAADIRKHAPGRAATRSPPIGGGAQGQVNLGQIQVVLTPRKQRDFHQEQLMAWVRARYAGARAASRSPSQQISAVGGGGGFRQQPIQFNVRGDDMDELVARDRQAQGRARQGPGLVDLDTTYRGGKPELDGAASIASAPRASACRSRRSRARSAR